MEAGEDGQPDGIGDGGKQRCRLALHLEIAVVVVGTHGLRYEHD